MSRSRAGSYRDDAADAFDQDFAPVPGQPGVWEARTSSLRDIATNRRHASHAELALRNPLLFAHGPPTEVLTNTGPLYQPNLLTGKFDYCDSTVTHPLHVRRAPWEEPEYLPLYHPHDPRLDPRYDALYRHDPEVRLQVQHYDELERRQRIEHEAATAAARSWEARIDELH